MNQSTLLSRSLALLTFLATINFANAQQSIEIYPDSNQFTYAHCTVPSTGSGSISGGADNFNSATDSIGIEIFWGDGSSSLDSVGLSEGGTTDYFYHNYTHTYTIAGTYFLFATATAANGIADTLDMDSAYITSSCVFVSGYTYMDANSNCSLEATDDTMTYIPIHFYNGTSFLNMTYTDLNGYYNVSLPQNLTGVRVVAGTTSIWSTECPSTGEYVFNTTTNHSFDFGLECTTNNVDHRVYHSISGVEAPGQCGVLSFVARASSCANQNATATLTLDPSVSYNGMISGPAPTTISGNTLTWNYSVQAYTNGYSFRIAPKMSICTDTAAIIGDTACFHVSVTSDTVNPNNNEDTWCLIIDGPWDPNNKTVSSPDMELNGNTAPDSKLTYRVNFQNTGTAPAVNVYILDSISNKLNLETFEVLASSHDMTPQLVDERVIRFNFKDINLVDSNANEPESHGFLIYSIEMKESLPIGTEIHNTAHIFFDYNAPIVTNTTVNTIYVAPNEPDPLVLQLTALDVSCLNSDNGALDLSIASGNPPYSFAWSNGETSEDQSDLPAGSYTVTVTDDSLLTATATAEIIEDRQFQDPVVGAITGPLSVQSWKPYSYVVTTPGQSEFEWTVSGGEILSTTNNSAEVLWHAGPDGTLYTQEKDANGCYGMDSTLVPILFVGIKETRAQSFSMYPNPTEGVLAIEVDELTGTEEIQVRDIHGRLIISKRVTSGNTFLDLRAVPSGVYNVSLNSTHGMEHQRLIVR
jgi:uncharacterized repeat protein (TIGR01451 family)